MYGDFAPLVDKLLKAHVKAITQHGLLHVSHTVLKKEEVLSVLGRKVFTPLVMQFVMTQMCDAGFVPIRTSETEWEFTLRTENLPVRDLRYRRAAQRNNRKRIRANLFR